MKKFLSVILFLTFSILTANAGGFNGQTQKASIVEALNLPNDSYVTVQGNIVKRLSSDTYMFKDNSGTMTVEIDNTKWGALVVNEKDTLELTGEIERKFNQVQLEVDSVKKIK